MADIYKDVSSLLKSEKEEKQTTPLDSRSVSFRNTKPHRVGGSENLVTLINNAAAYVFKFDSIGFKAAGIQGTSQVFPIYDQWKVNWMRFRYIPAVAATTAGEIVMAIDLNGHDAPPVDLVGATRLPHTVCGPVSRPMSISVGAGEWRFSNFRNAEYNCGQLVVYHNCANVPGRLVIDYDISFRGLQPDSLLSVITHPNAATQLYMSGANNVLFGSKAGHGEWMCKEIAGVPATLRTANGASVAVENAAGSVIRIILAGGTEQMTLSDCGGTALPNGTVLFAKVPFEAYSVAANGYAPDGIPVSGATRGHVCGLFLDATCLRSIIHSTTGVNTRITVPSWGSTFGTAGMVQCRAD